MLKDIEKKTVDFKDNFDGSLQEPTVLPTILPNLLINGSSGIAVGMATNIPPHNVGEVCEGIISYIENPDITVDELIKIIPAPDFPTGGEVICGSALHYAYANGKGKVQIKAISEITETQIIIKEILEGKDVLTVMPTGAGKSLCFQLPATLFEGLTLVVSPLIALMQSQVAQLKLLGVKARCLNSSNSLDENKETLKMLENNELKMLYVAPERLIKQETIDFLKTKKISLLAVDEAHCVSQWGHDFRKEYLKLGEVRKELSMVQTIALTATADETTRKDIVDKIFPKKPSIFIHSFDRPNIYLSMLPKNNAKKQILTFIQPMKGQTGIVYCSTRKKTEEFSDLLKANGFNSLPYHAGMSRNNRKDNLEAFIQED